MNAWTNAWYVLNYEDGIGSRLLAGTLLKIFAGSFIEEREVLIFLYSATIILFGLVALFIGQMFRKSSKNREAVIFFTAIYLACPGSVTYFVTNLGLLEMFSLIFFLIGIVMFKICRNEYSKYFVIFIFSTLALSAHQGTIFYYYPIIVTVLMYELCMKFSLKKAVLTFTNFVGVFLTFIYFQLFSRLNYDTLESALEAINSRTDMNIDENAVRLEYFASLKENFQYGQAYFLKHYNYEKMLILAMILLMPLVLFITAILMSYLKEHRCEYKEYVFYKEPIFYILLSYMLYIPIYVLMCDWGRWTGAFVGTCFFNIGYLYVMDDQTMQKVFAKLSLWIERNRLLGTIVIIYLAGLDKFHAIFSTMLYRLYSNIFG